MQFLGEQKLVQPCVFYILGLFFEDALELHYIPLATLEKTNWACVLECKKGGMFWTLEEGIMYDKIFWFESAKDFKIYSKMPLTLERPTHIQLTRSPKPPKKLER